MLVRAVQIHEPLAECGQRGERGGSAVHKLPVRSRRREGALDDKLVFLARLQSILVEKCFERRAQFRHVEDGLDGAGVRAGADERAVGALAKR